MFVNLDKKEWEKIAERSPEIFHRYSWQLFQKKLNNQVFQIVTPILLGIGIERKIKFIKYLYLPRSPYFFDFNEKDFINFLTTLKNLVKKNKYFYIKLEPTFEDENLEKLIMPYILKNFVKILPHQPDKTLIVKIDSLENAWKNLSSSRKYDIKKAQESNLRIIKTDINDKNFKYYLENFYFIHQTTSHRNKFPIYSLDYFQKLSECYDNQYLFWPRIYLAQFQEKFVAADFFIFTSQRTFYLFGGFLKEFAFLQAPSLILWEAIQDCFKLKIKEFDLWGYAPEDKKRAGYSEFKRKFGGYLKNYPGTFAWSSSKILFHIYNKLKYLYLKVKNSML